MATQSDALNWLNAAVGRYWNFDGQYGNQCVDLFNFYYQYLVGHSPYNDGYGVNGAKDLWNVPTSRFTKIADSNALIPMPGDIIIYGTTWGGGYGHVEMVVQTTGTGCYVVGNNMSGNPAAPASKAFRTWAQMRGLLGVMRFNGFNAASVGEDMITANDVAPVRVVMSEVEGWNGNEIHSGKDDGQIMSAWQGHSWPEFIMHGWTAQSQHRQNLTDTIAGLQAQIAALNTRPTQAQLDALTKAANEAKAQADAATKAAADAKAKLGELETQNTTDTQAADTFLRRLGQFLTKFFK